MLGLPVTERAYGASALEGNYSIIAFNAATCYFVGITAMEIVRAGAFDGKLVSTVSKATEGNPARKSEGIKSGESYQSNVQCFNRTSSVRYSGEKSSKLKVNRPPSSGMKGCAVGWPIGCNCTV